MGRHTLAREARGVANLARYPLPVEHMAPGTPAGEAHGSQDLARREADGECRLGRGMFRFRLCCSGPTGRSDIYLDRGDLRRPARGGEGTLLSRAAPLAQQPKFRAQN